MFKTQFLLNLLKNAGFLARLPIFVCILTCVLCVTCVYARVCAYIIKAQGL